MTRPPRAPARARYAEDLELAGMLHARIVRSLYPHARIARGRASARAGRLRRARARRRPRARPYGCQIRGPDRARASTARATSAIPSPRSRPRRRARRRRRPRSSRSTTRSCRPCSTRSRRSARTRRSCTRRTPSPRAARRTSGCGRSRARTSATASGSGTATSTPASPRRTSSSRRPSAPPAAQHAHMEPHACVASLGRRPPRGLDRHADAVQPPRGARARLRARAEERIRVVSPPMGGSFGAKTFLRTEAIAAALARKAGRPVKLVLPRSEEWQTLNRHPATIDGQARRAGRRDARRQAGHLLRRHGRVRRLRAGRRAEDGLRRAGPVPDPERLRRRLLRLHEPAAERRVPRLRPDAVGVGLRARDGRARRSARPRPARAPAAATSSATGDRYCTGETMHDVHFAECLEAAAERDRLA